MTPSGSPARAAIGSQITGAGPRVWVTLTTAAKRSKSVVAGGCLAGATAAFWRQGPLRGSAALRFSLGLRPSLDPLRRRW